MLVDLTVFMFRIVSMFLDNKERKFEFASQLTLTISLWVKRFFE